MKTPNLKAIFIAVVLLVACNSLFAQFNIVIDEIMADPSPQVALPNAEWIELKNTGAVAINLQGYRLAKEAGVSGPMPSFILEPDSFVVVCTSSQSAALSVFGSVITVTSFPSLSNDGDHIFLQSNTGDVVHFVNYTSEWYNNPIKSQGGWTLEMIDTKNPCSGASNWKASTDITGGSPCRKNSADGINTDRDAPELQRAFANDSITITLFFNEPLDAVSANNAANYFVSDGIGIPLLARIDPAAFNKVQLILNAPVLREKNYFITVKNISDCRGNFLPAASSARVGLPSVPDSLDIVINEILFDPKTGGDDFIELFNRSKKIIDLSGISIASRSSSSGTIGTPIKIPVENYLFFPGDYIALTPGPSQLGLVYTFKDPEAIIKSTLPSFPDTEGFALVFNSRGDKLDELAYSSKWHFSLVDDPEGISLERIDFNRPTNERSNWTSAASSAGFATPGYINSQFRSSSNAQGTITINPKMFSPDNDGYEDFTLIEFKFPEPGYVVNITIYDAAGRPVRLLQRNTSAAASGSFRWDGLDDKQQKVPVGSYIVFTDAFNLKGLKMQFKNTVVVAKKMQ
jgi:hypothetical protein